MAYNDFMNKVKQWDHRAAQWMSRHFYIILYEALLGIIFLFTCIIALKIFYLSFDIQKDNIPAQLLLTQTFNSILIVMLLLLISMGILNIINSNTRLRGVLKNIEFNLTKRRPDNRSQED